MALFEVTAYDKKVYEEELKDFLPEKILDVHTHVWVTKNYPAPAPVDPNAAKPVKRTVSWTGVVAKENPIEDLQETYRLMFPGKDEQALIFSNSARSKLANDYVSECFRKAGFPPLYFSHSDHSADELEHNIREGGFLGIKR